MAELVGEAEVRVDADTDPAIRALSGFSRDAQGRIRDVRGRFVTESAAINQALTEAVSGDAALAELGQFTRDAQGRLRDARGRFVNEANLMGAALREGVDADGALREVQEFTDGADTQVRTLRERIAARVREIGVSLRGATGESSTFGRALRGLGDAAGSVAPVLGRIGLGIGAVGAAAGSAVPLLAGMVATLEAIAPAGAVATTGMLAIVQASSAIKLGMVGVEDAVTSAFDTSEAGAKKFEESLKKLSPNARAFAQTIRGARDELTELQQSVQDKLFAGLDTELRALSTSVLPIFQHSLGQAAVSLNQMGRGVAGAVRELGASGTLGDALAGANQGLANLEKTPGRLVTAFGQLAAAAAPAFDRITAAIDRAVTGFSDRIAKGFESGKLTESINTAVDVLKDLGTVVSNVFGTLRNVMAPVQAAGGGVVGMLVQITGALREATATEGFQAAMGAIAQVMGTLSRTVGPLLGQALAALGPVFTTLGPPIQRLITSLGAALSPIISALGPVLATAADAVGALLDAVSPLLPVVGQLAAALLPPLVPLLAAVGDIFRQAAPVVQQLAQALAAALAPILAQLPALVQPVATVLTTLAQAVFPVLARLVVALTPALAQIGQAFGNLLVALAPLLEVLGRLVGEVLVALLPLLTPLISLIGRLAAVFASQLASTVTNIVVPALRLVTALLKGDFSGAWNAFKQLISGVARHVVTTVTNMSGAIRSILGAVVALMRRLPGRLFAAVRVLGSGLAGIARGAMSRFRAAVVSGGTAAVNWARGLPGRIRAAVSSLGGLLSGVARSALSRFRAAVASGAASAVGVARGIPGRIRGAMGGLGSLLYGAGQDIIRGMINGLSSMAGAVAARARQIAASAVAAAKSALGISSPSRVFATIGRDTGRGFVKGLTGTKRQIDQTADRVARSITRAFAGTGSRLDNRLVASIQRTNQRLQRLSVERDRIAKQIADARKFATDIAARARGTGSLGAIVQPDFFAPRFVEARMRSALASIKRFTANVEKLRKRGLSRSLLRQVLELGPTQGGGFAASLAAADKATIKRFNKLQSSIGKASTKLGKTGADLLFDSGRKASQGFLAGLKAQQKQIEALMLRIARGMQRSIRRALGIRSPSRVMAEVGRMSGLGLAGGLVRTVPTVDRAVGRLAGTVAAGVPNRLAAPRLGALDAVGALPAGQRTAGGSMPQQIHVHVHNEGVIGSRRELDNWLVGSIDRLRLQKRLRLAGG